MKRHVLLFGLAAGALIALERSIEYRYLVLEHSLAIYGGLIGALCAGLGLWFGRRLAASSRGAAGANSLKLEGVGVATPAAAPIAVPLTPREIEIVRLMADGLSTREIATTLSVSENTVKTHSSRLYDKLGARRRTQAVQRAREHALIP